MLWREIDAKVALHICKRQVDEFVIGEIHDIETVTTQ
jgi:hypothetical protein